MSSIQPTSKHNAKKHSSFTSIQSIVDLTPPISKSVLEDIEKENKDRKKSSFSKTSDSEDHCVNSETEGTKKSKSRFSSFK